MKKDNIWIPLLITGLVTLYYGFIIVLLFTVDLPFFILFIGIPLSITFTIMMIVQCKNRLKEIKGGKNDDLSQY